MTVLRSLAICPSDKTIKLWKVFEKTIKVVAENNMSDGYRPDIGPIPGVTPTQLRLPRLEAHENIVAAVPRKVYANAHAYHINSLSICSDGETFISSDDLRVNLWNLGISDHSFSKSHLARLTELRTTPLLTNCPFCGIFFLRHHRYQACQYGGAYRGCDCDGFPPNKLQQFHVLELKRHHQACRYACPGIV